MIQNHANSIGQINKLLEFKRKRLEAESKKYNFKQIGDNYFVVEMMAAAISSVHGERQIEFDYIRIKLAARTFEGIENLLSIDPETANISYKCPYCRHTTFLDKMGGCMRYGGPIISSSELI